MLEIIFVTCLVVWGYNVLVNNDIISPVHGCNHDWEYTGETYGWTMEFKKCKKCGKRKIVDMS